MFSSSVLRLEPASEVAGIAPEYGPGWKCKLVLPSSLESERLNVTRLTLESPAGETYEQRIRKPVQEV